jgi:5-methylcytosine-specific restriction enzyme A
VRGARVCSEPGCGTVIPGAGKCETHDREAKAKRDAMRPSSTERGYNSPEWRRIRAAYMAAHPVCEAPWGCIHPSQHCDHIDGSGPFGDNSDSNLSALCASCHSKKTVRFDGGFGHVPKEQR